MLSNQTKLLVVDDKADNHTLITYMLDSLNLELVHAYSGKEALAAVEEHEFAVILMDVMMPEMDGYEVTRRISQNEKFAETPIIMVTANHNSRENYTEAYKAGAVDYVSKPIEEIILTTKIKQFVQMNNQRCAAEASEKQQAKISSRMTSLLNAVAEGILGIDHIGRISFANPNACKLLNIDQDSLIGQSIQNFICPSKTNDPDNPELSVDIIPKSNLIEFLDRSNKLALNSERWLTNKGTAFDVEYSFEIIRDDQNHEDGAVITFQDISERKITEARLLQLANYDPLTSLANRAYFHDALVRSISGSKRLQKPFALLFLDLDHFKNINDSLGHDAGDALLKEISNRLNENIRAEDIAARIGGDEFAVIIHDIRVPDAKATHKLSEGVQSDVTLGPITDITIIANKLINAIRQPLKINGNTITPSTSIGITIYNDFDWSVDDLLKAADIAMYAAKMDGRNKYQFFETEMQKKAEERNQIQNALLEAIKNDDLQVHYQPKVSLKDDKVVGLEALVRWTTDKGVTISPAIFVPIAEESGQILDLGEFVFRKVCLQISQWQKLAEFKDIVVSVNVSAVQLKAGNFHQLVASTLKKYHIDPKHLELELTETAVMTNPDLAVKELNAIHELGVKIAIDDFGTGYSSLNYLKRFPIDVLKIDRSFVKDIGNDCHDEDIIKIVVAIADTLGIDVIAEGVETDVQLGFLASIGCNLIQGWFFSAALEVSTTTEMILNIHSSYASKFEQYHVYMNENNIAPLIGKMVH